MLASGTSDTGHQITMFSANSPKPATRAMNKDGKSLIISPPKNASQKKKTFFFDDGCEILNRPSLN